ncbi:MAG: hypothetical protein AAF915_11580 [Cyanobacteria bacterium P01_D01_bin.50]
MRKLDGDLEAGVHLRMEIGCEGARPTIEIASSLPAIPQMVRASQFTRIKVNKLLRIKVVYLEILFKS